DHLPSPRRTTEPLIASPFPSQTCPSTPVHPRAPLVREQSVARPVLPVGSDRGRACRLARASPGLARTSRRESPPCRRLVSCCLPRLARRESRQRGRGTRLIARLDRDASEPFGLPFGQRPAGARVPLRDRRE